MRRIIQKKMVLFHWIRDRALLYTEIGHARLLMILIMQIEAAKTEVLELKESVNS